MRKLIIWFYVLYVLIITYFSLTPIEHKITESIWDKAAHFNAYLFLVMFVRKVHKRFNYLTCVVICCGYSFVIECIQYFMPDRMFDLLDMLANILGTLLDMILYYLIMDKWLSSRNAVTANAIE